MRRFILIRDQDVTGVSGTGIVAEGVQFSGGWVSLVWLTPFWSHVWYPSIEHVEKIHGHNGATVVRWIDGWPLMQITGEDPTIDEYFRLVESGELPPPQQLPARATSAGA